MISPVQRSVKDLPCLRAAQQIYISLAGRLKSHLVSFCTFTYIDGVLEGWENPIPPGWLIRFEEDEMFIHVQVIIVYAARPNRDDCFIMAFH